MSISEKEIQKSYAKALKTAKTPEKSSTCCDSTCDCSSTQTISEKTNQQISFGCILLKPILEHEIKEGMTVIDFGSGPGHDLFIAAQLVGSEGFAIGVDFTEAMIVEAYEQAQRRRLYNIKLVKASIQDTGLPDEIADIIISNCVINLAINKKQVFQEAFRLLKQGGILIDADVIAQAPLPEEMKQDNELWCSCIGGALTEDEHTKMLEEVGFKEIRIEFGDKSNVIFDKKELGIYSGIIWATKPL
ncbi:MAG: methyltransferase domain-containing protein [Candidatus Hodarchaeota archaeon]